jgi:patatin-related protein
MEPFQQEVRFAVVVYGGVSLAIYINGVAQELLRLVRATAPEPGKAAGRAADRPLSKLEEVYRKLACAVVGPDGEIGGARVVTMGGEEVVETDGHVRKRFIVDVLSGTSAGGINAIFLAKALAGDQTLDDLAALWLDEADIALLLNDRKSLELGLRLQDPPQSLLNSQRMYLKLLQALDAMDDASERAEREGGPPRRQLATELDLFTTTTDLDGVPLPIELSDQMVLERRHRNVFHFQHPSQHPRADRVEKIQRLEPQSDFSWDINPFLAFAARCTSAFPFAFEPMALCDVPAIVGNQRRHGDQKYCDAKEAEAYWKRFYLDYTRPPVNNTPFSTRAFGDGGYLDNKPFTYAIETITTRQSDLPVDRKLIYIEPNPENPVELQLAREGARPDALENSLKALITLPGYEVIRQDLERVLEWNRNVLRVRRVAERIGAMVADTATVEGSVGSLGYRSYWRLRLSGTVDRMADRVCVAYNQDPKSGIGAVIRILSGIWRSRVIDGDVARERSFLEAYDDEFLVRAIQYLRARIDERRSEEAQDDRHELASIRRALDEVARRDRLEALNSLPAGSTRDVEILRAVADPTYETDAITFADKERAAGHAGRKARALRLIVSEGWEARITALDGTLRSGYAAGLIAVQKRLQALTERYGGWATFEVYDSALFPMVFGTGLGEFDEVDIVRISPADSKAEGVRRFAPRQPGQSKLKGTRFGAFGAFLDRTWRENDLLWGRLDGAERLITAVLPGAQREVEKLRKTLIAEAHLAIAEEWDRATSAQPRKEQLS